MRFTRGNSIIHHGVQICLLLYIDDNAIYIKLNWPSTVNVFIRFRLFLVYYSEYK